MASTYLSRTPSSSSNRKTFTISCWAKLSALTTNNKYFFGQLVDGTNDFGFYIHGSSNTLRTIARSSGSVQIQLITNSVYRDTSAWYHFMLAVDTTQSTSSDRAKMYVNGEQITSFSTETYPTQNDDTYVNTTNLALVGAQNTSTSFWIVLPSRVTSDYICIIIRCMC